MFKDNLKSLRLNKRMTQDELGKIVHVSGKTIGTWERGTRQPNIETINKLSDFFNVTTDYLLGREVKQPANNSRNEKADLVAAHIDDDVSESDMKQITDFIDFLKRKQ